MSQDPSDAVQVYTELRFSKNHYTAVRTHGQVAGLISHEEWVQLPTTATTWFENCALQTKLLNQIASPSCAQIKQFGTNVSRDHLLGVLHRGITLTMGN